ncbi:MAG: ATP-dependent DNA helicase [Opitutales bacterium]|nr:ATP-dependent DNA helicase [Opitutales bacterium]MDP4643919.1 ATP-dependent DNA helicase [Opitutales bacterium]MDP4883096.1 ATP-dependent DNA helicase [Opitutales bacterium]
MIGLIESSGAAPRKAGYLIALVESVFNEGGHLQTALQLDHRPEQAAMAIATAAALEGDQPLLFEAGTGVGKSLAYLIPGIIHSIETERPFIISSHTISLQEQIREKDLKICRTLFKAVPELHRFAAFKTALMVGKGNYCCSTRLSNALKDAQSSKQTELLANEERAELIRLAQWSATSPNGLVQELSPPPRPEVWDNVNADSSTCSRKNCDPNTCFYQRARKQLMSANCVIVNHSLLFALINAGMPPTDNAKGILLADDFVVLDEAHRIPAIATDHFGANISSYTVDRALKRIYNPRTNRGILRKHGQKWDHDAVDNALGAAHEFFAYLADTFLAKKPILRLHDPDFCDNIISGPLKEVAERLGAIIQKSDDERVQDELRDHRRRVMGYRDAINAFITFAEDDHVQWLERGGKKGQIVTLRSAPLDVAPYLRKHIFQRGTAAVLTSATLSDGSSLDTFQEKAGAEAAEAQIEYSPFNYKENCKIYIATDSPLPEPGQGRLDLDYLANMICWCSRRVEGGTLVLFTSHFDLRQVRERSEAFFQKINRPLFCQGHGFARTELTQQFAAAGNGVLFGTDSFWTGVDVPGPALSQVIIARLPFENPNHPVMEARSEYISERGGNPFAEMTIPDALVKFRQGMGRLIRRHEDTGNIVILDSRIVTKPYGTRFIEALPVKDYQRFNRENRTDVF